MTARETNHGKKSGRTQIEPENIYVSSTEKCPAVSPASTTTDRILLEEPDIVGRVSGGDAAEITIQCLPVSTRFYAAAVAVGG
eukprot:g16762.t1